jgi:hypothetical protein
MIPVELAMLALWVGAGAGFTAGYFARDRHYDSEIYL